MLLLVLICITFPYEHEILPDPTFLSLCARLGPLASFESLLSMHGEDVAIFNDMLVAVEDLRTVEFTLILVDKRTRYYIINFVNCKYRYLFTL